VIDGEEAGRGFVTFSVDDGHPTDLRTAELLARLGLEATFYVPGRNDERTVIGPAEIRELSHGFEIGSHTMNHRRLQDLSDARASAEIADGKKWLEDLIGVETVSFCYPGGKYNDRTGRLVAEVGFLGARTCRFNLHAFPADPFRWGVSTQAYSHGLLKCLWISDLRGTMNHLRIGRLAVDWELHFSRALDWVEANGGIAHLYLHSWETESLGEWPKLERALEDAASRKGLTRVTNGKLFALWHERREPARSGSQRYSS
jgi:peptidoglycan/xylan/chitin deacetylase (PgdA/CDA1 family)